MIIHDKKLIDMESNKLSKKDFIEKVKDLKKVVSVMEINYVNLAVAGNRCYGKRESTNESFDVDLDKLYEAYSDCDVSELNTEKLKKYVDRVQSPALAILKAINK